MQAGNVVYHIAKQLSLDRHLLGATYQYGYQIYYGLAKQRGGSDALSCLLTMNDFDFAFEAQPAFDLVIVIDLLHISRQQLFFYSKVKTISTETGYYLKF